MWIAANSRMSNAEVIRPPRTSTQYPVVLPGNSPSGRNTAPILVLERFKADYSGSVTSILSYLSTADVSTMLCQNGVTRLMGSEPTQWSAASLTAFLTASKGAWTSWEKTSDACSRLVESA